MNRTVFICAVLMTGCSSDPDSQWLPGEPVYNKESVGRIHGDERSPNQRYLDCSRSAKSRAERSRCATTAHTPDKAYLGIEMPLRF